MNTVVLENEWIFVSKAWMNKFKVEEGERERSCTQQLYYDPGKEVGSLPTLDVKC